MSRHEADIQRQVKQWLSFGDEDFHLAQHSLSLQDDCPFRLVAYHAQQCVEKYLKAYLVLHSVDFPYTHNISRLLELCDDNTSTKWLEKLQDAEELTPFAITTRYPGQDEEVTAEEAQRSLEIAEQVRQVVRGVLDT